MHMKQQSIIAMYVRSQRRASFAYPPARAISGTDMPDMRGEGKKRISTIANAGPAGCAI